MTFSDYGDICRVEFLQGPDWFRSEYPHPLVVVDYDSQGRVIGFAAAGPKAELLRSLWT